MYFNRLTSCRILSVPYKIFLGSKSDPKHKTWDFQSLSEKE